MDIAKKLAEIVAPYNFKLELRTEGIYLVFPDETVSDKLKGSAIEEVVDGALDIVSEYYTSRMKGSHKIVTEIAHTRDELIGCRAGDVYRELKSIIPVECGIITQASSGVIKIYCHGVFTDISVQRYYLQHGKDRYISAIKEDVAFLIEDGLRKHEVAVEKSKEVLELLRS